VATLGFGCGPHSSTTVLPAPGQDASGFLTAASPSMVVEVTPVVGHDPDPGALALLLQRATERCNKPGGIQLVVDPDVAPETTSTPTRTLLELHEFAVAHRRIPTTPRQAVLYVEYVDGFLANTQNIIGVAFDSSSIAIFKDQLSISFGSSAGQAEGRVLVHELGHELGLVDEGSPMLSTHADTQHPGHCTNTGCVMFWTLHGGFGGLVDLPPDDYDAACQADLRAAGGK